MLMSQAGLITEKFVSPVNDSHAVRAGDGSGQGIDAWLMGLVAAHDDLDLAIAALLAIPRGDDLLIQRLKKRKLQIKDIIAGLLPSPVRMQGAAL